MEDQDVYENVDGLAGRRQSDGSDDIYDIPHEPDYRESRGAGIQMERYVKINKSEQVSEPLSLSGEHINIQKKPRICNRNRVAIYMAVTLCILLSGTAAVISFINTTTGEPMFDSKAFQDQINMLNKSALNDKGNLEITLEDIREDVKAINDTARNGKMHSIKDLEDIGDDLSAINQTLRNEDANVASRLENIQLDVRKLNTTVKNGNERMSGNIEEIMENLSLLNRSLSQTKDRILHEVDDVKQNMSIVARNAAENDRVVHEVDDIKQNMSIVALRVAENANVIEQHGEQLSDIRLDVDNIKQHDADVQYDLNGVKRQLFDINRGRSRPEGAIRLAQMSNEMGRVEIYHSGAWGTVCDDIFDTNNNAANVVCRQIGYSGGKNIDPTSNTNYASKIWLDNVNCTGMESRIQDCAHRPWDMDDCSHSEDAWVECYMLRLVNHHGLSQTQGRLEVFHNGEWGTVCNDLFDVNDNAADVVCRQMGYRNGTYLSGTPYGEGSGHIWLDNVKCAGTEVSLLDCEHNAWDDEDCGHSEDVTIRCV